MSGDYVAQYYQVDRYFKDSDIVINNNDSFIGDFIDALSSWSTNRFQYL